ncbi:MAG: SHOCT domain-containing protein [Microbacterium sp.]
MMYGEWFGWGWMWFGGIVLAAILTALIVLIVRASGTTGRTGLPPTASGSARQIAEERLARGEISPDEFRQIARALEERT